MSRNTYTITVILKAFFADCRAQSKIFISENIETILDLENKISRIFGIKDFHLLSNEELLPSCEDIRLLGSGDIVCVLPNESQSNILLLPERFYSTNNETYECKKKKRRNFGDECPIKEKKCKKKRRETTSYCDEKFNDSDEIKVTKQLEKIPNEIKKKKKKDKSKAKRIDILQPELNKYKFFTSTPQEIKSNTFHQICAKKLNSSPNNYSLKMIVDNSSCSESRTEGKISKNESEINQKKTVNQSHSSDQTELKMRTENELFESKKDSEKLQKKGCSLYTLPVKKKNFKSWSTSPLLKTTNHVKINRVPITESDIDLSKFVFNTSDMGAVPVPNTETIGECIANDISLDLSKTLMNISQHGNTSFEECSPLQYQNESKINTFSKQKIDVEEKTAETFHPVSNEDHCMISTSIMKNTKQSEQINSLASDKVNDNKLENYEENSTCKNIVLKNWRQSVLDKLTDSTQDTQQNGKKTLSAINVVLKKDEDEPINNPSDLSLKSSEVMKSDTKSYKVKKGNRLNQLGLSYYLKLLDKSDWDVSKSVSNKGAEENDSLSENKEEVIPDKPGQVNNEIEILENIDLSSMSSTGNDFNTKRKRKRKHKKKVRADTPVAIKRCDFVPSKQLTSVKGTPKIHIRFQSEENDQPSEENAVCTEASSNVDQPNENVRILQNVSLDLSMQCEGNICHVKSSPSETDNGGSNISTVIPYNNVDEFKTVEKVYKDVSVATDDDKKETKLSHPCLLNLSESHGENENTILNEQLPLNTSNSNCKSKNSKSGFQRIALDYTNQNLISTESDKCISNSSCNGLNLSNTCQDEALKQAKVELLKAVGFLTPDPEKIQNITNSNEHSKERSITDITEDVVVST